MSERSTEFASTLELITKELGPAVRQAVDREISRRREESAQLRNLLARFAVYNVEIFGQSPDRPGETHFLLCRICDAESVPAAGLVHKDACPLHIGHTEVVDAAAAIADMLERRAAGFQGNHTAIFNGGIIAEELRRNAARARDWRKHLT